MDDWHPALLYDHWSTNRSGLHDERIQPNEVLTMQKSQRIDEVSNEQLIDDYAKMNRKLAEVFGDLEAENKVQKHLEGGKREMRRRGMIE